MLKCHSLNLFSLFCFVLLYPKQSFPSLLSSQLFLPTSPLLLLPSSPHSLSLFRSRLVSQVYQPSKVVVSMRICSSPFIKDDEAIQWSNGYKKQVSVSDISLTFTVRSLTKRQPHTTVIYKLMK